MANSTTHLYYVILTSSAETFDIVRSQIDADAIADSIGGHVIVVRARSIHQIRTKTVKIVNIKE